MSTNALAVREESGLISQDEILSPVMSLQLAKQRLKEFQEFVKEYLRDGEDYGTIPGTPKPTLYKPGADKLCELYGISDSYDILDKVEDFTMTPPLFDYTIRCTLTRIRTQLAVSTGLGSCNSYEGRYRWREGQRLCPECGKPAIIKGKEEFGGGFLCFGKKGGCGAKFLDKDPKITGQNIGRIENDDVATLKNTILKMAKKRAKVDATLAATRSSGIFTQDIEDITHDAPEPAAPSRGGKKAASKPQVEQVMCSECRAIGGHLPSCKYSQTAKSQAQVEQAPTVSAEVLDTFVGMVNKVDRKTRKAGDGVAEYFILSVVDAKKAESTLYCFHATVGAELETNAIGKPCMLKVSSKTKAGKVYTQVDDIVEIAGVQYKGGKPVQGAVQGEVVGLPLDEEWG